MLQGHDCCSVLLEASSHGSLVRQKNWSCPEAGEGLPCCALYQYNGSSPPDLTFYSVPMIDWGGGGRVGGRCRPGERGRVGRREVWLIHPLTASMNIALYAGIAGGAFVALIIIGVIVYCCCCREKDDKAQDREDARP